MNAVTLSRSTTSRRREHTVLDVRSIVLRLAQRVRSESTGTAMVSAPTYSPLAVGFLIRAGVSVRKFFRLVRSGANDAELMRYCMSEGRI